MKFLFMFRHSERQDEMDPENVLHAKDTELTERGKIIARETGVNFAKMIDSMYDPENRPKIVLQCSPFFRCAQTAKQIYKGLRAHYGKDTGIVFEDTLFIESAMKEKTLMRDYAKKKPTMVLFKHDWKVIQDFFDPLQVRENAIYNYKDHKSLGWDITYYSKKDVVQSYHEFYRQAYELLEKEEEKNVVYLCVSHGIGCQFGWDFHEIWPENTKYGLPYLSANVYKLHPKETEFAQKKGIIKPKDSYSEMIQEDKESVLNQIEVLHCNDIFYDKKHVVVFR